MQVLQVYAGCEAGPTDEEARDVVHARGCRKHALRVVRLCAAMREVVPPLLSFGTHAGDALGVRNVRQSHHLFDFRHSTVQQRALLLRPTLAVHLVEE